MFCYQCEQTAQGTGCTVAGVCGKTHETAIMQDLLIHATKGLAQVAHAARRAGVEDAEVNRFTLEALFSTVTNVNFDAERMLAGLRTWVEVESPTYDAAAVNRMMDLASREKWVEYSKAKDEMFAYTDTKQSPWYVVNADDKHCARLNCIHHLLGMIPYEDLTPEPIKLPPRRSHGEYQRPPITDQTFVPEIYRPV